VLIICDVAYRYRSELFLGNRIRGANSDIIEYPVFAHVRPPPPPPLSVMLVLLVLRFS